MSMNNFTGAAVGEPIAVDTATYANDALPSLADIKSKVMAAPQDSVQTENTVIETAPEVNTEEVKTEESKTETKSSDPVIAAMMAQMEAMQKMMAQMMEANKKPEEKVEEKKVPLRAFEAQAKLYFGEDLPPHLLSKAAEAFEAMDDRFGWANPKLANDEQAQQQLKIAKQTIADIEWMLGERKANQKSQEVVWSSSQKMVELDQLVENMSTVDALKGWKSQDLVQLALTIPAGKDRDAFYDRLGKEVERINSEKNKPVEIKNAPKVVVKNPAPSAPENTDSVTPTVKWETNRLPSRHEIMQRINGAARGN